MRRITRGKKTKRRSQVESEALEVFRETRAEIDPALLRQARRVAEAAIPDGGRPDMRSDMDEVPVDRRKNLMTVMKYAEKLSDHGDVMKELKTFLKS